MNSRLQISRNLCPHLPSVRLSNGKLRIHPYCRPMHGRIVDLGQVPHAVRELARPQDRQGMCLPSQYIYVHAGCFGVGCACQVQGRGVCGRVGRRRGSTLQRQIKGQYESTKGEYVAVRVHVCQHRLLACILLSVLVLTCEHGVDALEREAEDGVHRAEGGEEAVDGGEGEGGGWGIAFEMDVSSEGKKPSRASGTGRKGRGEV